MDLICDSFLNTQKKRSLSHTHTQKKSSHTLSVVRDSDETDDRDLVINYSLVYLAQLKKLMFRLILLTRFKIDSRRGQWCNK